jgi:hypothetical protein
MLKWTVLLLLIVIAVIGVPGLGILLNGCLGVDVSGWVQAGLALASLPIILYQLDQIRKAVDRRPELNVGLANTRDLPFSKVRWGSALRPQVDIGQGYAHFYLVIQNSGKAPARFVKVYLEHVNRDQKAFPPPLVKVSEYSEDKPSFIPEHNFDFVFRGGSDWTINPDDIEPFGFHITTSVGSGETYRDKHGETHHRMEYPALGEVVLNCIVWAEGLEQPVQQQLCVNIVPHLEKDNNGDRPSGASRVCA